MTRGGQSRRTASQNRNVAAAYGLTRVSFMRPDESIRKPGLQPMEDIDLMIANGWGDTPRQRMPRDWRTRIKPPNGNIKPGRRKALTS